jgi:hypothetical protein
MGACTAALAAIDGGARLWDSTGIWRSSMVRRFYRWKPLLAATGWIAALLVAVLLAPVVVLLVGVVMFVTGFALTLLGMVGAGANLTRVYGTTLQAAFASDQLPTIVPRLAMIVLAVLVLVACAGVFVQQWRAPVRRRWEGGWWWRLIGAPLNAAAVRDTFAATIWELIRGAAPARPPAAAAIGRRYAEVLTDNLGQPGFRELLLIASDLDARRDVVAGLLREPYRGEFLAAHQDRDRRGDLLDLTAAGRDHTLDLIYAAVTPPIACDPALVAFARDGFWRGETHRLADRPAAIHRLIAEAAAAGATQAIVVSAVAATTAPHELQAPRLDIRSRVGAFVAAAEATALRDAIAAARPQVDRIFMICPAHNPIGPFDFAGAYDGSSDRRQDLRELMERGYEDAYRQFIEPIVGASGDHLARAIIDGLPPAGLHDGADADSRSAV